MQQPFEVPNDKYNTIKVNIEISKQLGCATPYLSRLGTLFQGSRKRLKVEGAENQIPLICDEIPEFSQVLMDFYGCKTALLKKAWVQLHPHLRDPCLQLFMGPPVLALHLTA